MNQYAVLSIKRATFSRTVVAEDDNSNSSGLSQNVSRYREKQPESFLAFYTRRSNSRLRRDEQNMATEAALNALHPGQTFSGVAPLLCDETVEGADSETRAWRMLEIQRTLPRVRAAKGVPRNRLIIPPDSLRNERQAVIAYIDTLNPEICHPDLYKARSLVRAKVGEADSERLERIWSAIRFLARLPIQLTAGLPSCDPLLDARKATQVF